MDVTSSRLFAMVGFGINGSERLDSAATALI
jgi:hypothetical protein